jgi:hypothetical protein
MNFTLWPNSALKCVTLIVAIRGVIRGLPRLSKFATGLDGPHLFFANWERSLAICRSLESGLPMGYLVVANCGTEVRYVASDWTPVPAILHRQVPCLLRHEFLTRDFPGTRYSADCLGLKYTPMVSVSTQSRDTIPLKLCRLSFEIRTSKAGWESGAGVWATQIYEYPKNPLDKKTLGIG